MDLSLIVPCYNEEGNVEKFYKECEKAFENSGISHEYVFIDDGSADKTYKILKDLYDRVSNVSVVKFSRNFGKESGIFAGLKNANADNICIIDADLQQRPETAIEMYKTLCANDDVDCVCAYQTKRKEGLLGPIKSLFYKTMNSMMETEIKNGASDFRVFTNDVKEALLSLGEYHRFSKGIFSWVGFNVCYIPYEAEERNSGTTKWGFVKLLKYAFGGIVSFSTIPLKISMHIGSLAIAFSVVYAIVTLVRKLTSDITVSGFTQLVLLISFFSGIILLILGIIGEYISRIYQQVKSRPIYIAKEVLKRKEIDE